MRVLLLELPPLLRDIIQHSVNAAGGFELVTELDQRRSGIAAAPDFVVLGLASDGDAMLVPVIHARWPDALVLAVMTDGSETVAYECKVDRRVLGPMGPGELIGALQRSVRQRRCS